MEKFLSRRFLIALAAMISGVLIALFPESEEAVNTAVSQISGLVMATLGALGYMVTEASVDKAAVGKKPKGAKK